MIRRAGVAATLLLLISTSSVSAVTKTVNMVDGPAYQPKVLKIAIGTTVYWHNTDNETHTATGDNDGNKLRLFTFSVNPSQTSTLPWGANSAGSFPYHCEIHPGMKGLVKVKMHAVPASGTTSTTFTIHIGTSTLNQYFTHDIQRRKKGGTFTNLPSSKYATFGFTPPSTGAWQFRSRLRALDSGRASGWSPVLTVNVT